MIILFLVFIQMVIALFLLVFTLLSLVRFDFFNIKALKGMGKKRNGFGQTDDLKYTYDGNRLTKVKDNQTGEHEVDFIDRIDGTNDCTYHPDGCLQRDLNENISNINYDTYLRKPILVSLSTGESIKYIYDGSGSLITRELSNGENWDYIGGMILKDGVPYQIAIAEGRAMNEDGTWRNEYEYRNNVGNLWVSFTERDGKLQQSYAAGYTPFGVVIHPKVNSPVPCKFTYHGHEDHGDFGLRLTSMGARCYNQTIGEFLGHAPLSRGAPSWTGYRLGWCQPQNVNDPSGNVEVKQTGIGTRVYPTDGYKKIVSGGTAVGYSRLP